MKKFESHSKKKNTSRIQDSSMIDGHLLMKPLGKYLGMDAFLWHNPDLMLLNNTIENFPFEILWIGNQNEIKSFFDSSSNLGLKIKNCVLYGPDRKDNCSEKIISVNSIHEAIDYVNKLVFKPGILLFTASDSDAEFSIKSFKSHILKSQIQK